jgi:hypothetical protein
MSKEGINMASVFKKLISKELGENNYNKYFFVCQKSLQNRVFDSREIYNDIYERLKNKDKIAIKKMQERLNDTMHLAVRICRTYFFSFLFYLGAVLFVITKDINLLITIVSILLMTVSFLVKTYQFLVNKYCFIDAQIVLVYKTVLDKILLISDREKTSE